jgi:hypothetical protein
MHIIRCFTRRATIELEALSIYGIKSFERHTKAIVAEDDKNASDIIK